MAAIVGVMLLLNRQTAGLFEGSLLFLFPLPMVFYGTKYGWRDSWMLFGSVVLLSFIIGTPQTLILVASESVIGMVYGCGNHDGVETRRLIFRTILLAVVVNIMSMLVFAGFFGYDLVAEITEYKNIMNSTFEQMGMEMPVGINLDEFLRNVLVVSTIITGVMEGLITHLLSSLLLKRMHFHVPPQKPLAYYYPPKWSGYLGIAGLLAYFYSTARPLQNELLQAIVQGSGMMAVFYLAAYGYIAMMVISSLRNPRSKLPVFLLAFFMLLMMAPMMAILGYLYITTDMHERMMGGRKDAPES